MNLGKQKAFLIHFMFIALILLLIYIGFKYFLPIIMPFVIGFLVAMFLRKLIDFINVKTKIKRSIVSIILLLVFYSIIVILIIFFSARIFEFIKDNVAKLPKFYIDTIEPALDNVVSDILIRFPEIEQYLESIFASISESIVSFLTSSSTFLLGIVTGFAGMIPSIIIKLIFTIVASFFFTIDFHTITDFVFRQFPDEKKKMIVNVKDNIVGTIGKFIKAYATLISITFIELFIGFLILRVPNAFVIAIIIAIVDILPVLGTGAVLLPWCIIAFILGNNFMGIGILLLYIIITVVRQSLEPKIVGQQIGLHPIVTLLCMFIGAQLLGVVGLLLFPVTATIIKKLNDEGTIQWFK